MKYKDTKNWDNFNLCKCNGKGYFGIPFIMPIYEPIEESTFIGFNEAMSCKDKGNCSVHFYIDDYQFSRLWNSPNQYLQLLRQFKYVLAPDFSMFVDYPKALQLFNHYRKHWLASYWQQNGIKVIPSINWTFQDSFSWCFDGEPKNAIVSVSSRGIGNSKDMIRMFNDGYDEMQKRLNPTQVLYFGNDILINHYGNEVMLKSSRDSHIQRLRRLERLKRL